MNAAELEQSRAKIARELDTPVREGRLSRSQVDRFEIEALTRGYLGRSTIEEDGMIKLTLPTGENTGVIRNSGKRMARASSWWWTINNPRGTALP